MTKKTVRVLGRMVMLVIAAIFITGCGGGSESASVKGCGSVPATTTYQNQKYGFEFQYPNINASLKSIGGWANDNEPKITSRTPFDYDNCVSAGAGPGGNGSKTIIADREYCLITVSAVEPNTFSTQYEYISRIGSEDIGIVFSAIWGSEKQSMDKAAQVLFSQILSTLKFINGLKTYQSKLWGFEFQYPEGATVKEYVSDRDNENSFVSIAYDTPGIAPGTIIKGEWDMTVFLDSAKNNSTMDLRDWFASTFDKETNRDCKIFEKDINFIEGAYTAVFDTASMSDACADRGRYTISPDQRIVIKWNFGHDPHYFNEIVGSFKFTSAPTPTEPLSYSMTGVSAIVSKTTAPFGFTVDGLKTMADTDCGTQHEAGYFDELVAKFSGATRTVYNFKYTGTGQITGTFAADTFTVTLLPNKAGYTSMDQFQKDFAICAAGGDVYPSMLNSNWLLFTNSCGGGAAQEGDTFYGCDAVRKIVEPSLELD